MIKELLQEMFLLKEKGYYKQAIEILYKLLEISDSQDETAEIMYELAEVYFFSGNIERAMHYTDKLLEIAPEHTNALKLQIKLLSSDPQKRIFAASKLYTITNKPEDLKLYLALLNKAKLYKETISFTNTGMKAYCFQEFADAYYAIGEYEKAKELLETQPRLNEISGLLLAKTCYALNDSSSLKTIETKLADSQNPEVLKFIIQLEFDLMNYTNVVKLAENINIASHPETLYLTGLACLYTQQTIKAKKYLNILCEKVNNDKYKFALAMAYVQANQTTQAIETVTKHPAYLKLLTLLLNEKAITKNILAKEFLTTFEIYQRDALSLFTVADICFKRSLLGLVNDLIKLPHNPRDLKFVYYEIKLNILEKDYETAGRKLDKYKDNDNFALLYAELLNSQNNFSTLENLLETREAYKKNEFEQCCYYYARIFEAKGEYQRAIDIAQKGLGFVNNYTEMYYTLLYSLYKHIGNSKQAIYCLEKAASINPDLRPKLISESSNL